MARKAGAACRRPGCPGIVRDGVCDACGSVRRERDKRYNAQRPDKNAAYGRPATWARLRTIVLAQQPLCEDCASIGRVTPATEVHHVLALSAGGTNELSSLVGLCKSCHAKRTRQGE